MANHGSDGRLLAAAMFGAFGGVYLFYRGFQVLQRKRLIENTPTSKIRGAALGLVEVSGLATGPYTLPAPVTGFPCYYYRSVAWQIKRTGKNEHWEKVADESLHVPFYINDNTGTLLVDPQGAEMDIHRDFCETYSKSLFDTNISVPSGVAGFLERHGIEFDKKTKVEEFCIKPKNSLFILGTLSQNHGVAVSCTPVRSLVANLPKFYQPGPALSFQPPLSRDNGIRAVEDAGPAQIVRLQGSHDPGESSGMTKQGKVASALVKAGITNPAAWAAAGVMDMGSPKTMPSLQSATSAISGGAAAVRTALEPFDFHPATVLMEGTRNSAFYISWRSQRDVVKSLGWKSALMIWGGPALTVISVYVLSTYFGGF
ncbi:MAG: GIDE domain-containing protein [Terriglobales bacterium]